MYIGMLIIRRDIKNDNNRFFVVRLADRYGLLNEAVLTAGQVDISKACGTPVPLRAGRRKNSLVIK